MRALTLTQPWAGLVASGVKLVENRPRKMIKAADFGTVFAIHASRQVDEGVYERVAELAPEMLTIARNIGGGRDRFYKGDWYRLSRITSAVIAIATVEAVIEGPAAGIGDWLPDDQHRWYFGPVGYVLRDVRALAEPVPCRGALGFWTLPPDVAARVEAQLR